MKEKENQHKRYRPLTVSGLGGVAAGNGFHENPDTAVNEALEAAWNSGVRYFDTSPWYGLGLSERRLGHFLRNRKREEYTLSTKVGRLLTPDEDFKLENGLWKGRLNFSYRYDYSAEGTRKSIEDSLQRLGLPYLDIVYIHDLSPDNQDMKENWTVYFDQALKGAIPELTRMREEGIIKAWGFGVNTLEPALKAIEQADPDIFLSATQYSIIKHEEALRTLFPACEKRNISIVVGAPLNAGFLAGVERYDYSGTFPAGVMEKRKRLLGICSIHGVDLRTAALQFSAAPAVVSAVIPGAWNPKQAAANAASFKAEIPKAFWAALKEGKLIAEDAPVPA
ncbi:aldo/keto reductase [Flavobacterium chungbukense]|uniref:Aldo/keto reductase n=1 Tax=Flavobacterium chungbukense TaxID=877464 RepID=A0ABP7YED7_9FLAO|nr:aldo/keto reductase [Flavobacterium chungbukense]MCC4920560.1 aldo/keto reductase [Flavobacterium chungbukense]